MSRLTPSAAALLWPVRTPRAISVRQVEMVWARVVISGMLAPVVAQKVKNVSRAARIWWLVVATRVWLGEKFDHIAQEFLGAPGCADPASVAAAEVGQGAQQFLSGSFGELLLAADQQVLEGVLGVGSAAATVVVLEGDTASDVTDHLVGEFHDAQGVDDQGCVR
jgi:hypothetical protein